MLFTPKQKIAQLFGLRSCPDNFLHSFLKLGQSISPSYKQRPNSANREGREGQVKRFHCYKTDPQIRKEVKTHTSVRNVLKK